MRWLIRIVAAGVILAALAVAAVFLLPADRIAALAGDQIRAATGRELTLSGRLRPSLWPTLGVATGPVALSNAAWSTQGPMLRAEGLSVGLDLGALLGGDIVIREIAVEAPRIVLEKAADGAVNWALGGTDGAATEAEATAGAPRAFTLDTGRISDAQVIYIDHATGQRTEVTGLTATLALPDYQGPADLTLSADLAGQRLTARGTIGQFAALVAGQVSPVAARIALGGASAGFDGRAGLTPLAADGTLEADVSDLPALFAVLGQPAPDLPAGVGQRLGLSGQVTYAPEGSVHLRQARLHQDANVLTGAADLYLGGKPRLTGRLAADALDLSPFAGGDAGGGGQDGAAQPGWSTAPIDVSALGALDAELAITANSIDMGTGTLGPTQIKATLDDRRLVVDLERVQGYGGTVTGSVVVNGRGGQSVRGDLNVAGVAMQPLLTDLAGYERLVGQGDLSLSFLGSGQSLAAIMSGLSGQGSLRFGKGELLGLDLVGMLRTLDTSYMGAGAKTIFDSITASFTIKQGVLQNDDLSLVAPLLQAAGEGRVGLGTQTLDYRIVPTAFGGSDGSGGIKVPLLITGTWVNPKYRLDLEALARERLDLDATGEALEDNAREQASQKAAKELGLTLQDGETLEDAAKRKLKQEAQRGLRNLLGVQ